MNICKKIFKLSKNTAREKDCVQNAAKFWPKLYFYIGNLLQNIDLENFKVEILWKFGTNKLMVPLPVLISFCNLYESSWNLTFVPTGPVMTFQSFQYGWCQASVAVHIPYRLRDAGTQSTAKV
jgi:hypothetical protein